MGLGLALLLGSKANAGLFDAQEFYLDNGLRVIVAENHRVPIIKHMVWYKSGAADENVGKGGSAHLLEHLMFRGTEKVRGQEFNRLMEANGAESNAFTGQDMTAYHQLLDISRLELAMFLEADRMSGLEISGADFAAERDIVFQERKERVDNNPAGRFREAVSRALWQEHPYGRPVSGTDAEIMNLQKSDIEEYYRRYYAPNNAVLVLAGDIDVPMAKKLVQKYYGKLKATQTMPEDNFAKLKSDFKAMVDMSEPEIQGYRVLRLYAAPSYAVDAEDVYNLQALAEYMGGGETAKLYKKLVLQKKKALAVSADYNPVSRSYGQFSVSAVPASGVSPEELLAEIDAGWKEALAELNIDELEQVKQKMLSGLVYLRDNPEDAAYIAGSMAVIGADLSEIEDIEQKIKSVQYVDVRKAAEKMTVHAPQVTGILRPKGEHDA